MDRARSILDYYAEEGAEDEEMDDEEMAGTDRAIPLSVRERQLALMALDPNRI